MFCSCGEGRKCAQKTENILMVLFSVIVESQHNATEGKHTDTAILNQQLLEEILSYTKFCHRQVVSFTTKTKVTRYQTKEIKAKRKKKLSICTIDNKLIPHDLQ